MTDPTKTPESSQPSIDPTNEDGAAVSKLEADIQKHAPRVMKHMNEDHEDSLVAYVLALATGLEGSDDDDDDDAFLLARVQNREVSIASVKLTALDTKGFFLEVAVGEEDDRRVLSNVRVPYDRQIEEARELHAIAVAMHRNAYDRLGVLYKIEHGYYQRVWKMVAHTTQKALKQRKREVAVAGVVVVAGGYFYWTGGNRERSPKSIQ